MKRSAVGSGHVLLLLAAGCAVAVTAVDVASRFGGPLVVPLQIPDRYWADDNIVPGQVAERGALDTTVLMAVHDVPSWLRLATGAQPLLTLLALAVGAGALAGVVRTVAAGRPFDGRNPLRLALLAGAVLLGGLAAPLVDAAARGLVADRLEPAGIMTARVDLDLLPVLVAGALVVLAAALSRGARTARLHASTPG